MDNERLKNTFTKDDIPERETESIEYDKIKFKRNWSFWESYEPKEKGTNIDWKDLLQKIFTFDDILSFWQFWNNYPGSNFSEVFYNGDQLK